MLALLLIKRSISANVSLPILSSRKRALAFASSVKEYCHCEEGCIMRKMVFVAIAAFASLVALQAESFKAAVPQLSPASTETYKKLVSAVFEATGNSVDIQVAPFARCIYSIENKDVDVVSLTTALPDQKKWAALKYDYSTAEAFKIVFVLYSNKAKKLSPAELKKGNAKGYKVETDVAHTGHFSFPIAGSTNFAGSLQKVNSGTVDGFIFAQPSCDGVVKSAGLKNIHRQFFDTFSCSFLIQKGQRGGKVDSIITDGLAKIKANGKYQEILAAYIAGASTYADWQP
jgi:ABC-type amino acid transport substrate-binding protein